MSDELAVNEKTTFNDILVAGVNGFRGLLSGLATAVSRDLTPPQTIATYSTLKDGQEALENIIGNLRGKLVGLVQASGTVTTEKGSRELRVGDQLVEIRPHKTGLDPKKVEARIRSKGLNPADTMDAVITYKVNEAKLRASGALNADEMKACEYDVAWALQRPRSV